MKHITSNNIKVPTMIFAFTLAAFSSYSALAATPYDCSKPDTFMSAPQYKYFAQITDPAVSTQYRLKICAQKNAELKAACDKSSAC